MKNKEKESVWDYPRPPKLERISKHLKIFQGKIVVADTIRPIRILETSHPPVYYFPPENVKMELFKMNNHKTFCEWKGEAVYYDLVYENNVITNAAWSYPNPNEKYLDIEDYMAFYPSKFDASYVNGELVQAQPGDFYGGWITADVLGPFKGGPDTRGW